MAVPQIVIAAAPVAGTLAMTAARAAMFVFGAAAAALAVDKLFGVSKGLDEAKAKADAEAAANAEALATKLAKTMTTAAGDPVATAYPTPNGFDPHPAGQA